MAPAWQRPLLLSCLLGLASFPAALGRRGHERAELDLDVEQHRQTLNASSRGIFGTRLGQQLARTTLNTLSPSAELQRGVMDAVTMGTAIGFASTMGPGALGVVFIGSYFSNCANGYIACPGETATKKVKSFAEVAQEYKQAATRVNDFKRAAESSGVQTSTDLTDKLEWAGMLKLSKAADAVLGKSDEEIQGDVACKIQDLVEDFADLQERLAAEGKEALLAARQAATGAMAFDLDIKIREWDQNWPAERLALQVASSTLKDDLCSQVCSTSSSDCCVTQCTTEVGRQSTLGHRLGVFTTPEESASPPASPFPLYEQLGVPLPGAGTGH